MPKFNAQIIVLNIYELVLPQKVLIISFKTSLLIFFYIWLRSFYRSLCWILKWCYILLYFVIFTFLPFYLLYFITL